MSLWALAVASLRNRWSMALLTLLAIAVSVALLLGVERVRSEARTSFASTLSGTSLVVGARSGPINLLLYSVFRIGNATSNISWDSFERYAGHPQVAWAIPLALGDSHRGYRVLGTSGAFFEHYRYGERRALELSAGRAFAGDDEVVLGAEVARALGYRVGEAIVLAHGIARISLHRHEAHPFRVSGILAATGTPVDRTLHVSLEGLEALHEQGFPGVHHGHAGHDHETPRSLTAFLLGLHSPLATFAVQRAINQDPAEPLLAILPGVTLQELWQLMRTGEQALLVISLCVVVSGLIGMLAVMLAGLRERRREMAMLRALGARPLQIAGLLVGEAGLLGLSGILGGLLLFHLLLLAGRDHLQAEYGLRLSLHWPGPQEWLWLGGILLLALLVGLIPAWRAYRQSLADGLNIRC